MSEAARILEISENRAEAVAWIRGARRSVSLAMLVLDGQSVTPGDWVMVSAGFAVERLDEADAHELVTIREAAETKEADVNG